MSNDQDSQVLVDNEIRENPEEASNNRRNGQARDQPRDASNELVVGPRDEYNFIYFGFIVLGITTVLPWNFFITATDYWMYKFRNVTNTDNHGTPTGRTPLQTFFESYLAIASNFALLLTMILNTIYGQKFAPKKRLYVSLSMMLIIFVITTIFVPINTDKMQEAFFGITIVLVILITCSSAVFQAAIFGVVSRFPSRCMHAAVNGQAVAGLLAVAVQVLCMSPDTGPIMSGFWYFLASTMFLAFAIVCHWSMDNDYTRHYHGQSSPETSASPDQVHERSRPTGLVVNWTELREALRDSWQLSGSVAIVFWATLSVFPGVSVLVVPQHPDASLLNGRFFIPIVTFFLFNLGDLAGRMCSSYVPFTKSKNLLFTLTIARSLIPMLVLFCNVHPRYHTPVWFSSDIYYPLINTASALTNGYLFSSAMVMARDTCQKSRSELTGFIMASALGVGLTLGSITSTILLRII